MKLETYRRLHGLSQAQFALRAGISQRAVTNYERGRIPRLEILNKIRKATDEQVSYDDFGEQEAA